MSGGQGADGGGVAGGADEVRDAYVYLSAVSERPTAELWDLVDELGPVEAAEVVRAGRAGAAVGSQTSARREGVVVPALLGRAAEVGARFLHPDGPDWPVTALDPLDVPRRLRASAADRVQVPLRPFGLWWRGPARPVAAAAGLAVVGTRAPSSYGRVVAGEIGAAASVAGLTVVSGGAFGVDAVAHRAALASGGRTVAVLAGGVDVLYPRGNTELLEEVAARGALVSTHPPGTGVARYRFLDRNRVIAALSGATVVVEAAARSGALSTAAWAARMGRPVGAVPGPLTSATSVGCHLLVRDRGAVLLSRAEDAVELAAPVGVLAPEHEREQREWDGLDDEARRVLDALSPRTGRTVGEVAAESGLASARVRTVLGRLAADARVRRRDGLWCRAEGEREQLAMSL